MKLNYDLIKDILETVEENSDGVSRTTTTASSFKTHNEGVQEYLRLNYHYKILFDIGLVVGDSFEENTISHGMIPVSFYYTGLTFEGHKTLDAMRNETVWNQIKDTVKQMGASGLKQTPSLALAWIMGS